MPKIIEGLEEKILSTGRELLLKEGFSGLTMRSVADECGIGIGTVYNYYKNKEDLSARIMLADWLVNLAAQKGKVDPASPALTRAGLLFETVRAFRDVYEPVWSRYAGGSDIRAGRSKAFHVKLIKQLQDAFGLDWFMTELLLHFAAGTDAAFETILPQLEKLV